MPEKLDTSTSQSSPTSQTSSTSQSSPTSQTSPKMVFVIGLVSAIAVVSLVGFILLLMRERNQNNTVVEDASQPTANADADNVPPDITLAPVTASDHIRGAGVDAKVIIVEYSDLECPFCKRHHSTMKQIMKNYGDKVAWVYRHFPLVSLHSKAPKEAEAAECAAELGGNDGFWAMVDKIFEVTPANNGLDLSTLPDLAESVGLDKAKFTKCLDSGKHESIVQAQYKDAVEAGGHGTPYNVILGPNGEKIPLSGAYPYNSFTQVIDGLLQN